MRKPVRRSVLSRAASRLVLVVAQMLAVAALSVPAASAATQAASAASALNTAADTRTFVPERDAEVFAVSYRAGWWRQATLTATIESPDGTVLATSRPTRVGWMSWAVFSPSVNTLANHEYVVRGTVRHGSVERAVRPSDLRVHYRYRPTAEPSPTPEPTPQPTPEPTPQPTPEPPTPEPTPPPTPEPPSDEWPNADNTGVPAGVTLAPYTGPCTIAEPTIIDGVDATGQCSALLILAPDVVIKNSRVPRVDASNQGAYSVRIIDSNVEGGDWVGGAVWGYNITVERSEVTGGQHNVHCNENCVVTDSWLHNQYNPDGQAFHNNAFISNGGSNMVIRHNTLHCDAILNSTDGGCSGNLSLFGDFSPIADVTIDNNLFKANNSSISYCLYAGYAASKKHPEATNISVTNNVFERGDNRKCGVYGPVTGFKSNARGNTWSNNTWVDGEAVAPEAG